MLDAAYFFKKTREKNFKKLLSFFAKYENLFVLPKENPKVRTQWLAFPLTIKKGAPFSRLDLVTFLEENNIQTRPIFTGNILRQPGFKKIPHKKSAGGYPVTDAIMERGFVIGCHHGMEEKHLNKIKDVFDDFLKRH